MIVCLIVLMMLAVTSPAADQVNLVRNGDFETIAGDGMPDQWRASGDSRLVEQELSVDVGRDGGHCAKLHCRHFEHKNAACHAMLSQMDVPLKRGQSYRLTFLAKGSNIAADTVSIAISDTRQWSNCGLNAALVPTVEWRPYEFIFRATRDCPKGSRLQLWFTSTGTLWVDDMVLMPAGRDLVRPGVVIGPGTTANLVPNGSFECGTTGWGSAEWDRLQHWGGPMNRLFGTIDTGQSRQGRRSLRIELTPENQPVSYFDYYDLYRTPIKAPLAANAGFLEVEPGRPYVLSAWMKAAAPDTPARMAVRQFAGGSFDEAVRLSTEWQRHETKFTPNQRWCYVLAGPDLIERSGKAPPPKQATVWLDGVQLEQATGATDFHPRQPVELGIETGSVGNVFDWNEPLRFQLAVSGAGLQQEVAATVELQLTDFFDREVWRKAISLQVQAGATAERVVELLPDPGRRGFLKLHAVLACGDVRTEHSMRLAAIPVYAGDDSRFGVNHAYPWPHLLDLCRKAGLMWVRDWSLKWQTVEPEKGQFDFTETDYQIDRPLKHGLKVLGLLPFPSSNWASTAPATERSGGSYEVRRGVVAYAPRDETEFAHYVARTVSYHEDRVRWWQVFNEPVFTSYSLPRARGYTAADYARWTKVFAQAARRANPQCRILAGMGYLSEGQIMDDFEQFFAAGGLAACDAVDIHHYPRLRPPEFVEKLLDDLNAMMDRHGGRKPIWLTEYGYYADDDPSSRPMSSHGFNQPLPSERLQAAYAVRWAAIMFSRGVEKVFYHAGTCDGIDRDSLQGIFFEYAGTPHRIYAAQAVMAQLLTPELEPAGRLNLGNGVRAYVFAGRQQVVAVVWAPNGV
ncbi:MAG: carbohydrate binding domain-containing protein, partial [Thermoguttaceae bacterium]|nr:carbohydrate binding domain-containing protein [Thermoguttaceae bacterium]